jgi:hypothetical protein
MEIVNIFYTFGISITAASIIVWISREWITARLKASIQHEYDQKLEAHKARLQAENEIARLRLSREIEQHAALLNTAHAALREGQKAGMERKLRAIDTVWGNIVKLRAITPMIMHFIEAMNAEHLEAVSRDPKSKSMFGELSADKFKDISIGIEEVRPYVEDMAWALFIAYRALILRILFVVNLEKDKPKVLSWYEDPHTKNLITAVVNSNELAEIDATSLARFGRVLDVIERKLLTALRKTISGEESGVDAAQNAIQIEKLALSVQPINRRGIEGIKSN